MSAISRVSEQVNTYNREVKKAFANCLSTWKTLYGSESNQLERLEQAVEFALNAHRDDSTRNGRPKILHLLRVSLNLSEVGKIKDSQLLISGILHHILEKIKEPELCIRFGNEVSRILVEFDDEPLFSRASDADREKVIARAPTLTLNSQNLKLADMLERIRSRRLDSKSLDWEQKLVNQMPGANSHLVAAVQKAITSTAELGILQLRSRAIIRKG